VPRLQRRIVKPLEGLLRTMSPSSPAQIELKMHHKMDVDLINGPRPS